MERLATNMYAKVGRAFLKTINKVVKDKDGNDKRLLFDTLDKISLNDGFCLGAHMAEAVGMGDESFFYVYEKGNDPFADKDNLEMKIERMYLKRDCFSDLIVEPSAMGAWQAYLFHVAPTVMPVFWHGGYIRRYFIFSLSALRNITGPKLVDYYNPINGLDEVNEQYLIPSVSIDNNKASVSCCYWTDWGGLIRETVIVKFKGSRIASISGGRCKTLIKYDCGICY